MSSSDLAAADQSVNGWIITEHVLPLIDCHHKIACRCGIL